MDLPQPVLEINPAPMPSVETQSYPLEINQPIESASVHEVLQPTIQSVPPVNPNSTPEPPISPLSPPKKGSSIAKYFFFLTLVTFLAVVAAVGYTFYTNQQTTASNITNPPVNLLTTPTPLITACSLNDNAYKIGDSFTAADGCNTCTCNQGGKVTCTEIACGNISTTPTIAPKVSVQISAVFSQLNKILAKPATPLLVTKEYFPVKGNYKSTKVWQLDMSTGLKDQNLSSKVNNILTKDFSMKIDTPTTGEGSGASVVTYSNNKMTCILEDTTNKLAIYCLEN